MANEDEAYIPPEPINQIDTGSIPLDGSGVFGEEFAAIGGDKDKSSEAANKKSKFDEETRKGVLEELAQILDEETSQTGQTDTTMSRQNSIKQIMDSYGFSKIGKHVYGNESIAIIIGKIETGIMIGYDLSPNAQAMKIEGKEGLTKRVKPMLIRTREYLRKNNKELLAASCTENAQAFYGYFTAYNIKDLESTIGGLIDEAEAVNNHVKNKILPDYFRPTKRIMGNLRLNIRKMLPYFGSTTYNKLFTNLSGEEVYKLHRAFKKTKS